MFFFKVNEMVLDFVDHTTIQGLAYISSEKISGKLFWLIAVCSMLSLGMFWCLQMYIVWQNQQVTTFDKLFTRFEINAIIQASAIKHFHNLIWVQNIRWT